MASTQGLLPTLGAALLLSSAAAAAASPPTGVYYNLIPSTQPSLRVRHCHFIVEATPFPNEDTEEEATASCSSSSPSSSSSSSSSCAAGRVSADPAEDDKFLLLPSLANVPNAVSFQSANFNTSYLSVGTLAVAGLEVGRLGLLENPDPYNASFFLTPSASAPGSYTLLSLSKELNGLFVTLATTYKGPCSFPKPSADVYLDAEGKGATQVWAIVNASGPNPPPPPPPGGPATVVVDTSSPDHPMPEFAMGCHYDPGYTQQPRGWYSNLVYGSSFEKGTTAVYAWNDITSSSANAVVQLDPSEQSMNPNAPAPALQIAYASGSGVAGWSNRGIGNEGMVLSGGQDYEGYVVILAPAGGSLYVAANDRTSSTVLASQTINVSASPTWQQVNFTLTPSASTTCVGIAPESDKTVDCGALGKNPGHVCVRCGGELQVGLNAPGSVHVGFVFFEPGPWGRVAPNVRVLKSAGDLMNSMGVRVIRQGGTVSRGFAWKQWRGPLWQRGSMQAIWRNSLTAGYNLFEFADFCEALGITPVVTLAEDLNNATDWADLIEYCYGDETTAWGSVRINTDNHPEPYNIRAFELGNEQYNADFVDQVAAIEKRRATIPGAPPILYLFPQNDGLNSSDAARAVAAGLPIEDLAADCHVGGGGGVACAQKDFAALPTFNQSAVNLETNAGRSDVQRMLDEAADFQTWFAVNGSTLPRLRARTASFCMERSGHFDAFDQGISFFLPNMTWLQPPGWVHNMVNRTWQPNALRTASTGPTTFSASAQASDDGKTVVVQAVSGSSGPANVTVSFAGGGTFAPGPSVATLTLAWGNLTDGNTPAEPAKISPVAGQLAWPAGATQATYTVPPYSFTIMTFTAAAAAEGGEGGL